MINNTCNIKIGENHIYRKRNTVENKHSRKIIPRRKTLQKNNIMQKNTNVQKNYTTEKYHYAENTTVQKNIYHSCCTV